MTPNDPFWDVLERVKSIGMLHEDVMGHLDDIIGGKVIAQVDVDGMSLFEVLDPDTEASVLRHINPFAK